MVLLESNGALLSELKEALAKNEGLNVAYAGDDGEAGIRELHRLKPDLAIVGMFLKGTDGAVSFRRYEKRRQEQKLLRRGYRAIPLWKRR